MNENPTPAPPEQNRNTDPALPTSRRELRAEAAIADPRPEPPAPPVPSDPDQVVAPAAAAPSAPDEVAAPAAQPNAAPGAVPNVPPGYAAPAQPNVAPGYAAPAQPAPPAGPAGVSQPDFGPANPPLEAPAPLDEGTFRAIREPRRQGLALDGTWHQISTKYVVSQLVQSVFWIAVFLIAAAVVSYTTGEVWPWIPAGAITLVIVVSLVILPRQARALGYMLRGDDIVFRKGILWQRMVAVPYGRMQLIDITHGPLDRIFGVSKLKMVTAAASTGVEIPGLTTAAAEALRDTLIEVAETRRTGL